MSGTLPKPDRKGASANIKVFKDGMMVTESRHPILPHAGDTNLWEYQARLLKEMSGTEFAVYCGSVQKHSPIIFERARMLLTRLFGPDWLPTGYIGLELFLGQYAFTPGGIHQEPRSNLCNGKG
jgi:hypothetical protein